MDGEWFQVKGSTVSMTNLHRCPRCMALVRDDDRREHDGWHEWLMRAFNNRPTG